MMGNEQHSSWTTHAGDETLEEKLGRRWGMGTSPTQLFTKIKHTTALPSFLSAPHGYICVQRD